MKPQMNTDEHRLEVNKITEKIIAASYKVSNVLGCGFLEKVYENAMVVELHRAGLRVVQQAVVKVRHEDVIVGDYVADLLVEGQVVVELKAVSALDDIHAAQCLNYLKATGLHVALLINFGKPKVEVKRFVL